MIRQRSWASLLQRALTGVVDFCRRFAVWVVLAGVVLAGASGLYASHHLGIDTDTDHMFAASLPWRQHQMALDRDFPQFQGLLVAVINADVPEEADATAQALAQALAKDHTHFSMVRRPDSSPYLRREGLLLLPTDQLTDLLNRTIDAQPFLGKLAADPTARGLFSALSLLGQGVTHDHTDLTPYRRRVAVVPHRDGGGAERPSATAVLAAPAERQARPISAGNTNSSWSSRSSISARWSPAERRRRRCATRRRSWNSCAAVRRGSASPARWRWPTRNSPPSRRARSSD